MFHSGFNGDVNVNNKATVERLVSSLLTLNQCRHILSSIVCLHSHSVYRKLSQGEHARIFLKLNITFCIETVTSMFEISIIANRVVSKMFEILTNDFAVIKHRQLV